jgi:hypothetical protein
VRVKIREVLDIRLEDSKTQDYKTERFKTTRLKTQDSRLKDLKTKACPEESEKSVVSKSKNSIEQES